MFQAQFIPKQYLCFLGYSRYLHSLVVFVYQIYWRINDRFSRVVLKQSSYYIDLMFKFDIFLQPTNTQLRGWLVHWCMYTHISTDYREALEYITIVRKTIQLYHVKFNFKTMSHSLSITWFNYHPSIYNRQNPLNFSKNTLFEIRRCNNGCDITYCYILHGASTAFNRISNFKRDIPLDACINLSLKHYPNAWMLINSVWCVTIYMVRNNTGFETNFLSCIAPLFPILICCS